MTANAQAWRRAYLQGKTQGMLDARIGGDYRPRDGATGTRDEIRAYGLGYADSWAEAADPRGIPVK